jgi:C4-dicarboxylate transporter DctM subunit
MAYLLFAAFIVLVVIDVPIAIALGLAGVLALWWLGSIPTMLVITRMVAGIDNFPLLAVPMFVLAGSIMENGGAAGRLVRLASALVGFIRGGLGMVVIVATILFSGISGSSVADTAAIGSLMLPAMQKKGYPVEFATALMVSAGGMGILIPPCITMIIYAFIANTSVGALFIGGIIPGLVMGVGLMVLTYFIARRYGYPAEAKASAREIWRAFADSVWALLTLAIILVGIVGGVFTATEAAVIAVLYSLIVGTVIYKELRWSQLPKILLDTAVTSGVVMLVISTSSIFAWVLANQQIPQKVAETLFTLSNQPWVFLLLVNLLMLVVGCFLDATPALLILVPILLPLALRLGIDPVHFGIVLVANLGIGFITPPVGVTLFVATSITGVPIARVVKPLMPYFLVMVTSLLLITYVPWFTLVLPRLFMSY